ncbi:MAG TPA: prepilin-type N-terminal cleavage/methylation domain-containing protein [Candidatus Udaeobacter sp.]|nr:prepilin-type N-terminal cleavage/methylation domain-containing protein [Candidatus Udaeobacter sp.]
MTKKVSPKRCRGVCVKRLTNCAGACRGQRRYNAFTLIELVLVVGIITVLAGLVLSTVGYARKKGALARAETEIAAMSAALENYKADNAVYPAYSGATGAHALYQGLSGDGNDAIGGTTASTGTPASSGKSYMTLKPNMLTPNPPDATTRVIDPFSNDYNYRAPGTNNIATFDLWTTANANPPTDQNQWIKNW